MIGNWKDGTRERREPRTDGMCFKVFNFQAPRNNSRVSRSGLKCYVACNFDFVSWDFGQLRYFDLGPG
ncbi:hypothetical protein CGGC5_v006296 [Colletotrichum fructicola Nara gc5]|uniref:Uncharacterized protein n=1 Tax=Colletotrichum fructicola (strain Nara gc5) TaxID=1213859 RepID=A0A7J6JA07_COLFN|nr:hypothetical protein CGGC5_v006296 [Colletotrichum fructicola Nara gc5]